MLKYILKRILIFIPTLFAISLIAFVISVNAPGDPIDALLQRGQGNDNASAQNKGVAQQRDSLRHSLGLDLPVFYFTLSNVASPDTLYKIYDKNTNASLDRLINTYGDWPSISAWYISVEQMRDAIKDIAPDSFAYNKLGIEQANQLLDDTRQQVISLLASFDDVIISSKLGKIKQQISSAKNLGEHSFFSKLEIPFEKSVVSFDDMKKNSSVWKNWIPSLKFYGYNQYHRWLFGDGNWLTGSHSNYSKGAIRGDFGISYASQQAVSLTIRNALPWSFFFTVISVFFAYLISIPLGVQAAAKRGSIFDRSSSIVLFMLYSLPSFFMGTLLLLLFANPSVFNIFPAHGVAPPRGIPDGISLWQKFKLILPYLILPFICYTYSSLAFLSRTMRVAMLEVVGQDYIRTAKAKGLSNYLVIYKHGLRNALLPIITVFANIFPAAVGGSVILEFIFGIPGMGTEIVEAVHGKNYPMIVCVFTLTGVMTLVGYLIADILYVFADPRISYSKK